MASLIIYELGRFGEVIKDYYRNDVVQTCRDEVAVG